MREKAAVAAGQHYEYLLREMYYSFDHRRPNLTNHHVFMDRFTRPDYQSVPTIYRA